MSNIKKIIGVVLALVMALSVVTVAFAAEGDAYTVTVTAENTELKPGDTTKVTVKVTANYNVSAMSIPVFFDKSLVTVSEAATSIASGADIITDTDPDPAVDVSSIYEGSGRSQDKYGLVSLIYIAKYDSEIKDYNNEAVMTFNVTVNDGASGAALLECVEAAVKTKNNPSGTLYVAKNSSGGTQVDSLGEVIDAATIKSETINIAGATQPADLALTATGEADGVKIDTRITFGGQYAGVVYGFAQSSTTIFRNTTYLNNSLTATNGGTLAYGRSIGKAGYGTGTTITVKNADGSDSGKVYVVVIFGDVNCDGFINGNDTTACKNYVANPSTLTNLVVRMAANCQNLANSAMLYNLNGNDTTAIKNYVANTAVKVSQATLAATVNKTAVNAKYA